MRTFRSGGPGADAVIAAQRGDRAALDALLAHYLPLVYNIVGRAMNGHADTDDVVQETMLRAVRGIGDLRDPSAFRSWLVAVAVRQVRDHATAGRMAVASDPAVERADPGSDFEDLTILRLGLSGQRREAAEATRWLDHEDREVLALWWQEAAGALDRGAVASGLGLTRAHAAVRIGRMKERLTAARLVVRALRARPPCAALVAVTSDWDATPSPLWRKRVARHARDCPHCAAQLTDMVPAEQLLAGLPLLPVPLAAAPAWLGQPQPGAGAATQAGHAPGGYGPGSHGLGRHGLGRSGAARHGLRGHGLRGHGPAAHHLRVLPKAVASMQPKAVVAAVAATGCVAAGGIAVVRLHHSPPPPAAVAAPATTSPAPRPAVPRPRPTHRRSPRPRRTVSPPARLTAAIKGVCAWSFPGASQALAQSGASWYYNWSAGHAGIVDPPGVGFVPMIWGSASVTSAGLAQARSESHVLLGFNEPDLSSQANMTVADALRLWPRLMATGMELGSPAVAAGAATPGGWLDRFMRGAAARGYRVSFIAVHWYGADFATAAAVSQLRGYLQAIHDRYHLPIWLTEFGLVAFGHTPQYPADGQQAAFLTAATSMLSGLGYVQRYAWFALPVTSDDGNMGLFSSGPVVTRVGRAFEAAGR